MVKNPSNQPRNGWIQRRRLKLRKRTKNLATWNVQGLSRKLNEVVEEMKNANIDIAILTETKKKGIGSENIGPYDHFYSGVPKDKRAQQGVSIMVRKNLRRYISNWEAISERIIKLNICICGYRVTILGIYAINDDALVEKKDEFFEQLHDEILKVGTSRELIIMGDMNSRVGKKDNNSVIGKHGEGIVNNNGQRLIEVCEQNHLRILNGFYPHKEIHKYTWTQNTRELKSIIDYSIIKQTTQIKVHDVRAYRGITCGSDHHLLKMKTAFPGRAENTKQHSTTNEPEQNQSEKKFNLNSLEHDSVKELYRKRLDDMLGNKEFEDIQDHYNHIKNSIHQAAKESLGYHEPGHKRKPYWWDKETEKLVLEKKQKYLKFLNTKATTDKIAYKEAQALVRRHITQRKNDTWEKNCNRLNTYLGGRQSSESWKFLKTIRQETKKDIISPITPEVWNEYFAKLLNEDREKFLGNRDDEFDNIHTTSSPIRLTVTEIRKVCKRLKNGKSPGPGNIPEELVKYGTDNLFKHLTSLFQKCINQRNIPEEWSNSIISTIHKKGSRTECNNYRGIAVTSSISRIYGKVLKIRIEMEYSDMEAEEQAGFRAGRSTLDHLFCLTQLIEKKVSVNQEVHCLYVDLKKAYDSVPHRKLWAAMEQTNIETTLVEAAKTIYNNLTAKVKVKNKTSNGFKVTKGLKQGCPLSPTLFKIYLEQALKNWKRKCERMGIPLNEKTLYTLCFADDQIVIAQDYDDLEYMSRKLIEEYDIWGLEVNLAKTEYMCIGGQNRDLILENGKHIKHCTAYKYLGVIITNDGLLDTAIKERNTLGRRAISVMNSIIWDQQISKTNKHRIYNTIIKSIISYGSEVWPLKQTTEKSLETTEMDYWRRAAGRSKREKIRNTRIREIMNVKHTIVDDIRTKQLRWLGHVQRMEEHRIPKQIIGWKPYGRRKRGRPRLSWREGVDREMRERDLEDDLWNDREQWRLGIGRRRRTF